MRFRLIIILAAAAVLFTNHVPALAEVRLASWNVMRLKEDNKDLQAMAEVARYFDLIALQEVMEEDGAKALAEEVSALTGEGWQVMVSHEVGRGSYKESYAFLWRERKIEYVDGATVYIDDRDFFEREPMSARFRAKEEGFDFVAANIHVIYGKDESRRVPELAALRAYWHWLSESWPDSPILLFGDFNMKPSSDAWSHLLEVAYPAVVEGATTLSTHDGRYANLYDNIWLTRNAEFDNARSGILRYPEIVGMSHEEARRRVSDHAPVFLAVDGLLSFSASPLPPYDPDEVYVSSSLAAAYEDFERPPIVGNGNSKIYHWPGCPGYEDTAPQNVVGFADRQSAEAEGYRAARNC